MGSTPPPWRSGWRWVGYLAALGGQAWTLLILCKAASRLQGEGSAGSPIMQLMTGAVAVMVVAGWVAHGCGRRRIGASLWIAAAAGGAGFIALTDSPPRAGGSLVVFGTLALSALILLLAAPPRAWRTAAAAAAAFAAVIGLAAARDWRDGRLPRAAQKRDAGEVKALLAGGGRADLSAEGGLTPLMAATREGNVELVRALIAAGGSAYLRDDRGRSAMMMALERQDDALAVAMLQAERERLDISAGAAGGGR